MLEIRTTQAINKTTDAEQKHNVILHLGIRVRQVQTCGKFERLLDAAGNNADTTQLSNI